MTALMPAQHQSQVRACYKLIMQQGCHTVACCSSTVRQSLRLEKLPCAGTPRRTVKLLVEHEDAGDQELRAVLLGHHEGHNRAMLSTRDVGRLRSTLLRLSMHNACTACKKAQHEYTDSAWLPRSISHS